MSTVTERLLDEISRICEEKELSERSEKILKWFAQECISSGSRIERSELKAQLIRLGTDLLDGDVQVEE